MPSITETTAMSVVTAMMIPSSVRKLRSLCARRVSTASRMDSRRGIARTRTPVPLLYFLVLGDFSIADVDDAVRVHRDVVLVRDQQDGIALRVQPVEECHDFLARGR